MVCKGAITSTVLTAAGGFIANGGLPNVFGSAPLAVSGPLASATSGLASQPWMQSLTTTLGTMKDSVVGFTSQMTQGWNMLQSNLGSGVFNAALGSFGPSAAKALENTVMQGLNTAVQYGQSWASQTISGVPFVGALGASIIADPSKLGTIVAQAEGYAQQANKFINSALNSDILTKTYQGFDKVVTGGLDGVSTWAKGLGDDVLKLGNVVSWDNISKLGSPGQLLANIANSGNIGDVGTKLGNMALSTDVVKNLGGNLVNAAILSAQGSPVTLNNLGIDVQGIMAQGAALPAAFQKLAYNELSNVTGPALSQVQKVLGSSIPNLASAQDLLNPQKILPKSFQTLQTIIKTASPGWRAIYENESGSVNPELNFLGNDLKGIIPDDLAIANAALARSFGQVKNITNTKTDALGSAISTIETAKGLPDIQNQATPLLPEVKNYWLAQYGDVEGVQLGTGNNGTYTVCDMIGYASGYNSAQYISQMSDVTAQIQAAGGFLRLDNPGAPTSDNTGLYQVIQYFCQGEYNVFIVDPFDPAPDPEIPGWQVIIPPGVWGEGTYGLSTAPYSTLKQAFEEAWLDGILPAAEEIVGLIQSEHTELVNQANALNDVWTNQLAREYLNQQRIQNNNSPTSFTGTISGTILTVTNVISGELAIGQLLTGGNDSTSEIIAAGTTIVAGSGTKWEVSVSQETTTDLLFTAIPLVDFSDLRGTNTTAMQFAENLHRYGNDTAVGGVAQYLEGLATDSLGGQSVVAAMREGRNISRLQAAGLADDTSFDQFGVQPQAELSSGQNTEEEAMASLIKS